MPLSLYSLLIKYSPIIINKRKIKEKKNKNNLSPSSSTLTIKLFSFIESNLKKLS